MKTAVEVTAGTARQCVRQRTGARSPSRSAWLLLMTVDCQEHAISSSSTSWRRFRQVVREIPIAGVLGDLQDETKFEASGIAQRGHHSGQFFVVFDKQVNPPLLSLLEL
jgi:hypothetical protein